MKVFAISDLHLSLASDKPMDRFGVMWQRHWEKVEQHWRAKVGPDDVVLVVGDHSWGLKLSDALPDLQFIAALPGHKIMSKGNHDLWWQGPGKLLALGLSNMFWLQNNAASVGNLRVAGTRGWSLPGTEYCAEKQDRDIYAREVERLKLSLAAMAPGGCRMAVIHYPPLLRDLMETDMTRLFEQYEIRQVAYGHLHVGHLARAFQGTHRRVVYRLVSCDVNGFEPVEMMEV